MSKREHGGPAAPTLSGESYTNHPGMTIRDWFAGQALVAVVAWVRHEHGPADHLVAKAAYGIADAMLARREVEDGEE